MINKFSNLLDSVKKKSIKKMVVAVPEDKEVMSAIKLTNEKNLIKPILVGDEQKILNISKKLNFDLKEFEIIDIKDSKKACEKAVKLTNTGEADILMKGMVDTSTIMKEVLNKEYGLCTERLISHIAMFESSTLGKLIFVTDGGMNIKPDLKQRKEIIENAIEVTNKLGYEEPKVAILAAIEKVNPNMEDTIQAAALSKMGDRNQIEGGIIDGPLALDNALSKEAAKIKGIESPVAGEADILHVRDIVSGNILGKSSVYLAGEKMAAIIGGTTSPVVVTSRANTAEIKMISIATAVQML